MADNPRQARSKICPTSLVESFLKLTPTNAPIPEANALQIPPARPPAKTQSPSPQHAPLKAPTPIAPEMLFGKRRLKRRLKRELWLCWRHRQTGSNLTEAHAARVCLLHLPALVAYSSFYLAICLPLHPRRSLCMYLSFRLLSIRRSTRLWSFSVPYSTDFDSTVLRAACVLRELPYQKQPRGG